ncbi:molecular chaperone TorD family protein [Bacillus subtilis]|uniref:molecular chaperone TorD family protein n=1 Tax=Bacillus subtilis TaxID=1423 RepID=UPI003F82D767
MTSLLAESAGIQKVYEDYTQHFIGSNFLNAPLWKSIYLDLEHRLFEGKRF